jgi:hypothetical protein
VLLIHTNPLMKQSLWSWYFFMRGVSATSDGLFIVLAKDVIAEIFAVNYKH